MATLAALKAEIDNDPSGLGYKAAGEWKSNEVIAGLLNAPNHATVRRTEVPSHEITSALDQAEFKALDPADRQWVEMQTRPRLVNTRAAAVFDGLTSLYPNATAPKTRAALVAAIQKQGSRAEELFGDDKTVHPIQVAKARNL